MNVIVSVAKELGSLMTIYAWMALGFAPMLALGFLLSRKQKAYKAEAEEPFTKLPLRPPGESLRLKIIEITDRYDTQIVSLVLAPVVATMAIALTKPSQRIQLGVIVVMALIGYTAYIGRKILRVVRELWDYRLGFTGERVVGEELNQLLAAGFRVFHDVPFENGKQPFNIDHVLVGPPGVFAVETKTRRKPADIKGLAKATVYSDGATLRFPKYDDTDSIPQARLNAQSLSEWLTSATGEPVTARAILTIPGWAVQRTRGGDVNVLRPDEIQRSFVTPKEPLSCEQIQRIAHQLAERCRTVAEKK